MNLIEIDVVELQPLEALIDCMEDVGAGQASLVWPGTHAAVNLGSNHDLVASNAERLERLPGQALGTAAMIDVRRVQKIHPAVESRADDAVHRILAEPADRCPDALRVAEGHCSEADLRNDEAGITELFHAHAQSPAGAAQKDARPM